MLKKKLADIFGFDGRVGEVDGLGGVVVRKVKGGRPGKTAAQIQVSIIKSRRFIYLARALRCY